MFSFLYHDIAKDKHAMGAGGSLPTVEDDFEDEEFEEAVVDEIDKETMDNTVENVRLWKYQAAEQLPEPDEKCRCTDTWFRSWRIQRHKRSSVSFSNKAHEIVFLREDAPNIVSVRSISIDNRIIDDETTPHKASPQSSFSNEKLQNLEKKRIRTPKGIFRYYLSSKFWLPLD
mmetsp:Transcript_67970/g.181700  ORF Transcript_67970/g.181700 Transcript_67970/m.181700 type:complete len:173 (+) Transcript_67970:15-533(+)